MGDAIQGFLNLMNRMTYFQMTLFYLSLFLVYIGVAFFIVTKTWALAERQKYNEIFIGFLDVMGIIFGIIVGTVIVAVWQASEKANGVILHEASAVEDLYRVSLDLPRKEGLALRELLRQYINEVIHVEWPSMRKGIRAEHGWKYLETIQSILGQIEPKYPVLVNKLQTYIGHVYDYRRQRMNISTSSVSYLIYVLIFVISAFLVLFCTFFGVPNQWAHFMMCVFLAILLSLTISTIIALDWPFQSQIRVKPTEMKRVREAITRISE